MLDKMYDDLITIESSKTNSLPDIRINEKLTEKQQLEIISWKTKMKANAWKSQQRSLRKRGKLEQYKIDALNKLGMLWNPSEDEWEKNFIKVKADGLIHGMETWVKEQRELFKKKLLTNENLYRLESIDFPFEESLDEKWAHSKKSIWDLKTKLFKKRRRLELELLKLQGKYTNKRENNLKKTISKKEKARLKNEQNKINSFYNRKYNYTEWGFVKRLSQELALKKLSEIDNGVSLESSRLKEFLDAEVKEIESSGGKTPHYIKQFYDYDVRKTKLNPQEIYEELSRFLISGINPIVKKEACLLMLKYIPSINLKNSNCKEIPFLINIFRKEKNKEKLIFLKNYIDKYPVLGALYADKINEALIRL